MNFKPVGVIHSPWSRRQEAPHQGKGISEIELSEEYAEGLRDIETFTHIHVIYWLHESDGFALSVRTPWDPRPHGLFATRTYRRPNPIGYAAVKLIKRENNILKVEGLDAIEGTKVIDIKPYIPEVDRKEAGSGWLAGRFRA